MRRLAPAVLTFALLLCLCSSCARRAPAPDPAPAETPTKYRISATLLPDEQVLSVETEVTCSCPADDLAAVKLRLYGNAYREGNVVVTEDKNSATYPSGRVSYGEAAVLEATVNGERATYDLGQGGTVLTVRSERSYLKGEEIRLCLTTRITLANCRHRLGYADGYYFLSDFYPAVCPFRDGKYLTYEYLPYGDPFLLDASDFEVDLTLPAGYECAAPVPAERREAQGTFERRGYTLEGARDFSVVCSRKLLCASDTAGNVPIRYYYEKDGKKAETLTRIRNSVEECASLFGTYPYPSYAVVVAPFFEAGVEHSGLTVVSSALSVAERNETILHETAHQWWYGKVGSDGFRDPWMDEGLAEYTVALSYRRAHLTAAYRAKLRAAEDAFAVRYALKGSDGVRFDLPLPELSDGYYDRAYGGGLLLFASLEGRMGEERLLTALRHYADAFDGRVASEGDLIATLSDAAGEDLTPFFRSWLSGGVPIE